MKRIPVAVTVVLAIALAAIASCSKGRLTAPTDNQFTPRTPPLTDVVEGSCGYGGAIPSTGTIKVGVVSVTFSDTEMPASLTNAAIEGMLFTNPSNVRGLYSETSYNQLQLGGSPSAPSYRMLTAIELPFPWPGTCNGVGWSCQVMEAIHQQLGDSGTDAFNTFNMFVWTVAIGPTPCDGDHYYPDVRSAVIFANDNTTDLTGFPFAYSHEMGHPWWGHASRGGNQYGDHSDIMGGALIPAMRQANAPHRITAQWVSGSALMTVDGVDPNGNPNPTQQIHDGGWNEIGPLSVAPGTPATRPVAVYIPVRNQSNQFYTVSYRIDAGYDAALTAHDPSDNASYIDLLTVHKGFFASSNPLLIDSVLLDFVPAGPGIIYVSPGGEFQIRNVSLDDTKARFKIILGDLTPPSTPILTLSSSCAGGAHATWTASVDGPGGSGFDHYEVYYLQGGFGTLAGTTTNTYWDFTVSEASVTAYVKAYDVAGNYAESAHKTAINGDGVPPSTPTALTATAPHQFVTLSWPASTDNCAVAYYEIERLDLGVVGTSGSPGFIDGSTVQYTTYAYRVRARDTNDNWSGWTTYRYITTGPDIDIQ